MYELLDRLHRLQSKNNETLMNELMSVVPHEKLAKYLVTFKTDICSCLDQMRFFEKSIDGIV